MTHFAKPLFFLLITMSTTYLFSPIAPAVPNQSPKEDALPPSWRTTNSVNNPKANAKAELQPVPSNWFLGLDGGLPDLLTVEGMWKPMKWLGVGIFAGPPIPLKIRVEMPSDVVSTKNGVGIATPDYDVNFTGTYGPNYGLGVFAFPFGGTFFVHLGLARRYLELSGEAQSYALICSIADVAKEPPCPDPNATIRTRTELVIAARATTDAWTTRLGLGWMGTIGERWYFKFLMGVSQPIRVRNEVSSEVGIDTKSKDLDAEVLAKLANLKETKENELNDKAIHEIDPYTRKTLPILTFSLGLAL